MTRYKKGNRNQKEERIKEIANILDIIYSLMWLKNYYIDLSNVSFIDED